MAPIFPLLAAGASLAGQVMTNQQNSANTAATNRMNYRIFQEQNQYNLEQWQRNNEYNTPKNQRLRYEEAGINPYLALSNITPGMSQASTSASANAMQAPQISNPVEPAVNAYNSSMAQYIANKNADTAIKTAEADIANKNADTATKVITNNNLDAKFKAEIKNTLEDSLKKSLESKRIETLLPSEVAKIEADTKQVLQSVELQKMQESLLSYELKHLKPLEKQKMLGEISSIYATASYLKANTSLSYAQIGLVAEQKLRTIAETAGINISNDRIQTLLPFEKEQMRSSTSANFAGARASDANSKYLDARRKNIDTENAFRSWDAVNGTINSVTNAYNSYQNGRSVDIQGINSANQGRLIDFNISRNNPTSFTFDNFNYHPTRR